MNKFFLIIIFISSTILLFSCGNNSATTSYLKSSNQSPTIGQPIKIENLLVAQYDFPNQMNQRDAEKACTTLGDGWRLPTKDETVMLMKYFIKQNNLEHYKSYWSSNIFVYGTQITDVSGFFDSEPKTSTNTKYTKNGYGWKWTIYEDSSWYATYITNEAEISVRAVRTFGIESAKKPVRSIDIVDKTKNTNVPSGQVENQSDNQEQQVNAQKNVKVATCRFCSKKFIWSNTSNDGVWTFQGYVIPERGSCAEQIANYASTAQFALKNNIPGGQELVNYLVNGEKYCSKKCVREDHYCLKKGDFE